MIQRNHGLTEFPKCFSTFAFTVASILISGPDGSGFEAFTGNFLCRINAEFAANGNFAGGAVELHGLIRRARKRFTIPPTSGAKTHGHARYIHHATRTEKGNTMIS